MPGASRAFTVPRDITRCSRARAFTPGPDLRRRARPRDTRARVFTPGSRSPMLARVSAVAGEMGAADHEGDMRGLGAEIPDRGGPAGPRRQQHAGLLPARAAEIPRFPPSRNAPRTNLRSPAAMRDLWSLHPEPRHPAAILFSDRGLPREPARMPGFGSHTYSFWNAAGERIRAKVRFNTRQGIASHTHAEGAGATREGCQEALFGAIGRGRFPRRGVQSGSCRSGRPRRRPST